MRYGLHSKVFFSEDDPRPYYTAACTGDITTMDESMNAIKVTGW
jgi:hypothetical protein